VVIYLALFAIGLGPYLLLCPKILRDYRLVVWLVPVFGIMLIIFFTSWVFLNNGNIFLVPWLLILCSLVIVAGLPRILGRWALLREIGIFKKCIKHWPVTLALPALIVLVLLAPISGSQKPEMLFHIGSDQVGYSVGAEYLLGGGKLKELQEKMIELTGESDPVSAVEAYTSLVDFSTAIQSNNLLQGRRWGTPFVSVQLASLLGLKRTHGVMYVSLALFQLGLFFVALWLLSAQAKLPTLWSALGATALTLNCNLLNIILEGAYAQAMTVPILILIWGFRFRMIQLDARAQWRSYLFLALALSGILLTYSDLFYITVALVALATFLDLAFKDRIRSVHFRFAGVFALGVTLCLAANWKYVLHSILDLSLKVKHNQAGGFWQPLWAWPSEIFGFLDIYSLPNAAALLMERPILFSIIGGIWTIITLLVFIETVLIAPKNRQPLWLVPGSCPSFS